MNTATAAPNQAHPITRREAGASLVRKFAAKFNLEPDRLAAVLKATCFKVPAKRNEAPPVVSNEQLAALLIVADQYGLNPFTKEIYAFPDKQGGIVPVIGVDGWSRLINTHPDVASITFVYSPELVQIGDPRFPGLRVPAPEWIECVIRRRDRDDATPIREYLDEAYRPPYEGKSNSGGTYTVDGPWQSHTRRMLRHKAMIQAGRIVLGYHGVYDEDEAGRIVDAEIVRDDRHAIDVEGVVVASAADLNSAIVGGAGQAAPHAASDEPGEVGPAAQATESAEQGGEGTATDEAGPQAGEEAAPVVHTIEIPPAGSPSTQADAPAVEEVKADPDPLPPASDFFEGVAPSLDVLLERCRTAASEQAIAEIALEGAELEPKAKEILAGALQGRRLALEAAKQSEQAQEGSARPGRRK